MLDTVGFGYLGTVPSKLCRYLPPTCFGESLQSGQSSALLAAKKSSPLRVVPLTPLPVIQSKQESEKFSFWAAETLARAETYACKSVQFANSLVTSLTKNDRDAPSSEDVIWLVFHKWQVTLPLYEESYL